MEVYYGAQDGSHVITKKKVDAEIGRRENYNGSHIYIVKTIDERKEDENLTLIGENESLRNTEQRKPDYFIKERLIDGRSHDGKDRFPLLHLNNSLKILVN